MAHLKKSANTTQAIFFVGPVLTEFRINRMAFVQPERTCLNIQMKHTYETTRIRSIRNSVNPKFGQSGVYHIFYLCTFLHTVYP